MGQVEGRVVGALIITSSHDETSKEELGTIDLFARIASRAIANADFYRKAVQAEEALRVSEEKYRGLFENSTDFIYTLDLEGNFPNVNRAAEQLTGYTKAELLGMNFKDYTSKGDHERIFQAFSRTIKTAEPLRDFPLEVAVKDGSTKYFETSAAPLLEGDKMVGVQGSSRDGTEQKHAEQQIKRSLKEKEVMLREIHHRVKNNLQVISSLLKLQASRLTDEAVLELFTESQNRIRAMSLLHERLYRTEDFARIDFSEYVRTLARNLLAMYRPTAPQITLAMDIRHIFFEINTAIPCGLIINELVTNCLKHAFPGERAGTITISILTTEKDTIELSVSDGGVGIPEDIDVRTTESLGLHLVGILAQGQLNGEISVNRGGGTTMQIIFPAHS